MGSILVAALALSRLGLAPETSAQGRHGMRVVSEQTATDFAFPASVAYDPQAQVLYVSQCGSELKPTQKDGKGKTSKVSLHGKVLEDQFLPPPGTVPQKPKGIWVKGNRLWVTDIDVVWLFDLTTRQGRQVELPGIQFANDPALLGNALYVSDNRGDQLYRVEPADFLHLQGEPQVTRILAGKSLNPNGLYPVQDRSYRRCTPPLKPPVARP